MRDARRENGTEAAQAARDNNGPEAREMAGDGRGEGSAMKTEQEIRDRIAEYQRSIDEEVKNGWEGEEDWKNEVTIKEMLLWVLGE